MESSNLTQFGYSSQEPCKVCGQHKNNQMEPRFLYTVCEDHQEVSPVEISHSCEHTQSWRGLTIEELADEFYRFESAAAWYQFACAIECKLKAKNEHNKKSINT